METRKGFLMLFRLGTSLSQSTKSVAEEQKRWRTWISGLAARALLVSTHQLGLDSRWLTADVQLNDKHDVPDHTPIACLVILKATNFGEALTVARDCPVLADGGSIEICDIVPAKIF